MMNNLKNFASKNKNYGFVRFFSKKKSSLQCDEVKTHVVTNLISFQ